MATRVISREPKDPQYVSRFPLFITLSRSLSQDHYYRRYYKTHWRCSTVVCVSICRELYKEALENVSAYNSRLRYERRLRIPFIDAQTGIAMNNCHLWISKLERRAGQTPHYIYSYPARRWRKKKRPPHTERPIEVKAVDAEGKIGAAVRYVG